MVIFSDLNRYPHPPHRRPLRWGEEESQAYQSPPGSRSGRLKVGERTSHLDTESGSVCSVGKDNRSQTEVYSYAKVRLVSLR